MNKITQKQLVFLHVKLGERNIEGQELCKKAEEYILQNPVVMDVLAEITEVPFKKVLNPDLNEMFYQYKQVKHKAAILGQTIVEKRPFGEQSDQTAVMALLMLMSINGQGLVNYNQDIGELLIYLKESRFDDTVKWIENHWDMKKIHKLI